jgi:putative tryptophan/tyrosine transport system substrate-binding protein
MRRREFIGVRVAYVFGTAPLSEMVGASPSHPHARTFLNSMRDLGYVEGSNLVVERRSAEGEFGRLPEIIRELVSIDVDVIVSATNLVTRAAKEITQTVPVVVVANALPVEL